MSEVEKWRLSARRMRLIEVTARMPEEYARMQKALPE